MKYIVITGVSSGIGAECAKHMIDKGYHVFGSVRSEEDASACSKRFGQSFTPLIFDVRDHDAILSAAEQVKNQIGDQNLAALINNAGIAESGPIQFVGLEEVQRQFDINVIGLIKVSQAFIELLGGKIDNQKPSGRIINISSVTGTFTMPLQILYASSKHAVESITDGMRRELEVYGIHVISIRPGPIQTAIWEKERAKKVNYDGTIYQELWSSKESIIVERERVALPVSKIALVIEKALNARKPKLRYLIVRSRWRYYLMRLIPSRWADSLLKVQLKKMGLTKS